MGLREVMTVDGVVGEKTTSNHIMEVEKVLGIEAARQVIIEQIDYTMSSHGLGVDPRHIMLLGDVMCFKVRLLIFFSALLARELTRDGMTTN
jgi:DNA-directed RNA polymerase III subunit RPC1